MSEVGALQIGTTKPTVPSDALTSGLNVRRFEPADIEDVLRICRLAHEEGAFRDIPFSEDKVRRLAAQSRDPSGNRLGLVAVFDGRVAGLALAVLGDYFIGQDARITTVQAVILDPAIRSSLLGGKVTFRLVRTVMRWSEAAGAVKVMIHNTSGVRISEADRFFRKLGFRTLGGNYVK